MLCWPRARLYGWNIPKMARVYMPDLREVGLILAATCEHWSVAQNPFSRRWPCLSRTGGAFNLVSSLFIAPRKA